MLNIVFMGTPDFAQKSLQAVVEAGHHILAVVTNPDKPQGRGMKLVASPVKRYALERGIQPIYQPQKVKQNEEFLNQIRDLKPDVICVVAYGKILPQELLNIPKFGCINVHGSLLPKYRGAAPIQWAVLNGDHVTGITTMYMDAGMDTGDMILKQETQIGENETTGELWERLSALGAELLVKTLELVEQGKAPREKQPSQGVSMAPMLQKEMAKIDWENQTTTQIHNLVRGLNPIMGAYTFYNHKKLKFWKVKKLTNQDLLEVFADMREYDYKLVDIMPGTILFSDEKQGLFIKTKDGILQVIELQAENARKMKTEEFLRGNELEVGTVFSDF